MGGCATSGQATSGEILVIHKHADPSRGRPSAEGVPIGGTICPSANDGKHDFHIVRYGGRMEGSKKDGRAFEQTQDRSLDLGLKGSTGQKAEVAASHSSEVE